MWCLGEMCDFMHAAQLGFVYFLQRSDIFQTQNSWYSSPSKAVIKHVQN